MKELFLPGDRDPMAELLQLAQSEKLLAIAWQLPHEGCERLATEVLLEQVNPEQETFKIAGSGAALGQFSREAIYFYLPFMGCIFRSQQQDTPGNGSELLFPQNLKILDPADDSKIQQSFAQNFSQENAKKIQIEGADLIKTDFFRLAQIQSKLTTIWMSGQRQSLKDNALFEQELEAMTLSEEDAVFASARVAPRARAKVERMVLLSGHKAPGEVAPYQVFDLSRSGLSFLADAVWEFSLKAKLEVHGFDHNQFEQSMVIEVMNIRPMDKTPGQYKIGCRFLTQTEVEALK